MQMLYYQLDNTDLPRLCWCRNHTRPRWQLLLLLVSTLLAGKQASNNMQMQSCALRVMCVQMLE
jgi:hypothetical protein